MATFEYRTRGTCSSGIVIDAENGIINDVKFIGGCPGNTQGVAALVRGMEADEVISRLRGIRCGLKNTSCPDQLALALTEMRSQ